MCMWVMIDVLLLLRLDLALAHFFLLRVLRLFMQQIDLKADVSTALVTELSPKTNYSLTVYAIYPSLIGDSATVTALTSWCHPLSPVQQFSNTSLDFTLSNTFLSYSSFASGVKLPCYRGGSVLPAFGLDTSSREAQWIQDLHPKMYVDICQCNSYY